LRFYSSNKEYFAVRSITYNYIFKFIPNYSL